MITKALAILLLISSTLLAQYNGSKLYLSANYIFTTTSKLYLQPNSSDAIVRGTHENLDDIWSYSSEVGYRISEDIILALSFEFVEKTFVNQNMRLGGIRMITTDGYKFIPVEFSIYYSLPFSTENFKFFMGGGGGLYFGNHIRRLGDISVSSSIKKIGYGIQVSVGMDYLINKFIALRTQMRFRDPEFEMNNTYSSQTVNYDGRTFLLSSKTFSSKVNVDGISFAVGLLFHF